ncbi:MAG: hypothetical protein IPJ16_17415 [Bacteroidales bacterium]|nr:hypothetical protein [Bacteroidales bacterium]
MTFDNSKTIISLRIKLFAATVVFLAYIVLTYIAKIIKFPLLGMSDTTWTLILVAIYLIIAFLPMILNYQYVYYSDDTEKIIFRYFTAGIVGGRKNTVEIDKRTLSGYEIVPELFGLRQKITLYQRFNEGVAKYPPFYISALSKEERAKMVKSLNLYSTPA